MNEQNTRRGSTQAHAAPNQKNGVFLFWREKISEGQMREGNVMCTVSLGSFSRSTPHPGANAPELSLNGRWNGGFTLIELLVVMLIVGILAAISLPQYQKAVYKAKLTALIPFVTALTQAQEAYYLEHGEYTSNLSELNIDFPKCTPNFAQTSGYYDCTEYKIGVWDGPINAQVIIYGGAKIAYLHYFQTDAAKTITKGDRYCFAKGNIARQVCASLGAGTETPSTSSHWDYVFKIK